MHRNLLVCLAVNVLCGLFADEGGTYSRNVAILDTSKGQGPRTTRYMEDFFIFLFFFFFFITDGGTGLFAHLESTRILKDGSYLFREHVWFACNIYAHCNTRTVVEGKGRGFKVENLFFLAASPPCEN